MPSGAWRGIIVKVDARGLYVNIPRIRDDSLYGPVEPVPGETFVVGDGVLCAFFEGGSDRIEVLRKTAP